MIQLSFDSNCIVLKYIYVDHEFHMTVYILNFMNAYCQISPFWTFDSFNFLFQRLDCPSLFEQVNEFTVCGLYDASSVKRNGNNLQCFKLRMIGYNY